MTTLYHSGSAGRPARGKAPARSVPEHNHRLTPAGTLHSPAGVSRLLRRTLRGRSSTPPDYRTPRSQPAPMPTTGPPAGATKPPDTQTTRQNQPAPLMPSLVKC